MSFSSRNCVHDVKRLWSIKSLFDTIISNSLILYIYIRRDEHNSKNQRLNISRVNKLPSKTLATIHQLCNNTDCNRYIQCLSNKYGLHRAQWRSQRCALWWFRLGPGLQTFPGRHQCDQHSWSQRLLQWKVSCARKLLGHPQQRQRRWHWVRWVRFFM